MASILGTTALMLNGKLVVLPVYLVILCEEGEPEVHVSVTTIVGSSVRQRSTIRPRPVSV